jgi:sarcosine oxidase, subunit alpha
VSTRRVERHPILSVPPLEAIACTWQGRALEAREREVISSTLMAHGVTAFGSHHVDGSPQGIFCANGQCAQCLVVADGRPVKACTTPVRPGMRIEPLVGLPTLPHADGAPAMGEIDRREVPVMIVGGGPAGLAAAAELGAHGVGVLLVDDKPRLGGKLLLQTHRFFGSLDEVHAGTRGIDIAARLEADALAHPSVTAWRSSAVLAVFSDGWVGVLRDGRTYVLVRPEVLLVAAGARERALTFAGNTLPGVYGAGAFQTLLNRDLVRPADRLFVVGGGNVGLITAYHAVQAGITVVGLVEALPSCSGYAVHERKLARLGVPVHTSHTIVSANGDDRVTSVTVARVDARLRPVPGSERSYACDTVLVAVGLDPVDEFTHKAREAGLRVVSAGDAEEIAEASAAMVTGRLRGREIARTLGAACDDPPDAWRRLAEVMRSRPGTPRPRHEPPPPRGVYPVIHCDQEIPCNPCTSVCPHGLIAIDGDDLRGVPAYLGGKAAASCIGCERCLRICPGLAITIVDARKDPARPLVSVPFECARDGLLPGGTVTVTDVTGAALADLEVVSVRAPASYDGTAVVKVRADAALAPRIAGVRVQPAAASEALERHVAPPHDDAIVCRCERVHAADLRALIERGLRDANEIKAIARAGMGACGSKTCAAPLARLFREAGVADHEITPAVRRPLFVEVPLGAFAGVEPS